MNLLQLDLNQSTRCALENPLLKAQWNFKAPRSAKWEHELVIVAESKADAQDVKRQMNVHVLKVDRESAQDAYVHSDRHLSSDYARLRDLVGAFWRTHDLSGSVLVSLQGLNDEQILGALVGIGLASYSFRATIRATDDRVGQQAKSTRLFVAKLKGIIDRDVIDLAQAIVTSMNFARHLANLPAATANPDALAKFFKKYFNDRPGLTVDVWGVERLKKENMGLLLAVGQGSQWGARFVHLQYRPRGNKRAPIAFVGKGITFDSGGLDIKPSSGMRLMKKDMTGVAIMSALCDFVSRMRLNIPCDFYLPIAENCVSDRAMRPGDIFLSRAGHYVEIDNTDAEGRLVMADAFAVAVENAEALIDVSTLTGAMRVAVGLDVAGFFTNQNSLAKEAEAAGQKMGEMTWRMPLIKKYEKQLSSHFADFKNCTDSGFGGAITAALFLQKFIRVKGAKTEREIPWLHFDVMAWNNSADGAIAEGSNAQTLQTLIGMLLSRK